MNGNQRLPNIFWLRISEKESEINCGVFFSTKKEKNVLFI